MKTQARFLIITMLFLAVLHFSNVFPYQTNVLGASTNVNDQTNNGAAIELTNDIKIETTTAFEQKIIEDFETIVFDSELKDDDDTEYGTEKVLQEGVNGKKTYKYLATVWGDEEIDRKLIETVVEEPVTEIVAKGTKIVWRELPEDYGDYKYWYKLRVWATKYDGNCDGCRGLTYSGTLVRKGVCAVDPKVIPLGTNFYVVGYGMCRSEDIGGGIKGNKVDLGYEDVMKGEWRTGWTDVYLLTNSPEGDGGFYD